MGKYRVAAACSSTNRDGSFLKFPSDPNSRGQWSKEVKRTRDHWSGTSNYSILCEKHLTADSFEPHSAINGTMGLAKRKRLKYGAIPTVFEQLRKPLPLEASEPSSGGFQYSHSRKESFQHCKSRSEPVNSGS